MLTSLDFLNIGQPWPPTSECDRLGMYRNNRLLFEGEHESIYAEDLKRIERVIGNFEQVISYPVVLNFQKIMSLKIADLLIGEPPEITAGDAGSQEQIAVDAIVKNSKLFRTLYKAVIDTSRYGDGLLYIKSTGDGGKISLSQPAIWFPVVAPDDVQEIVNHVIAWTYEVMQGDKKRKYLKVRIHSVGSYEERLYRLDGETIAQEDRALRKTMQTNMDGFAIIQVSNVITSDRSTGLDDYTDVDSIIAELIVRVGQVARILDKHASPSMQGPQTALEQDPETGAWRLKLANYFPRSDAEEPEVKYITWDGQLDAAFKHIERLINLLYTISEMGSAIFGDLSNKTGAVPSGSALKRLMISPLAKVNRIRMNLDDAVKEAIRLCSQLGGKDIVDLSNTDISITWRDGLPSDPLEEAQIINQRTGGKATMSVKRVLTQYDGMSDDDAQKEYDAIQEEEAAGAPLNLPGFAQRDNTGNPPAQ